MSLLVQYGKDLTLPELVRDRYGLSPDVPVRIIETRDGILLVPLTGEPMPPELLNELSAWQDLSTDVERFPYDDLEEEGA